ncbi:MAG: hypothetical protein ACTSYI_03200 [Promethearchaeota archaeon]
MSPNNKIVIDKCIFQHAFNEVDPWNRRDKSSFYTMVDIRKKDKILVLNSEILSSISGWLDTIPNRLSSKKLAIVNILRNQLGKKEIIELLTLDKLDPPQIIGDDDEDYFFVARKFSLPLITNDEELRKCSREEGINARYSGEYCAGIIGNFIEEDDPAHGHTGWIIVRKAQ